MISICVPAIRKPQSLKHLVDSIFETAADPQDVEVIACINTDEPYKDVYLMDKRVAYIVVEPTTAIEGWNLCAEMASGDIIMACGHTETFLTDGWDILLSSEFEEHKGQCWMVAPSTGRRKDDTGTPHYFINREMYEALGYLGSPIFYHWHMDTYMRELAEAAQRFSRRPDIIVRAKKETDDNEVRRLPRQPRIHAQGEHALQYARKHLMHLEIMKIRNKELETMWTE